MAVITSVPSIRDRIQDRIIEQLRVIKAFDERDKEGDAEFLTRPKTVERDFKQQSELGPDDFPAIFLANTAEVKGHKFFQKTENEFAPVLICYVRPDARFDSLSRVQEALIHDITIAIFRDIQLNGLVITTLVGPDISTSISGAPRTSTIEITLTTLYRHKRLEP